jgi:hypothetical protein
VTNSLTIRTPADRISYIRSLDLAVARDMPIATVRMDDEKESADVVDGSTVSFVSGVPALQKADVLNSTLLAQLAANKKYDRENETIEWYHFYTKILENLGWVLQGLQFAKYVSGTGTFTMDKAVLDILKVVATGNQAAAIAATLTALGDADNGKALTIFDSGGSTAEAGAFQISCATADKDGNVAMALGAFYFKATEHHTRFLFWEWKSTSVNMYSSAQSVTLNEPYYATVRAEVIAKLGTNAKKFIAGIEL